jgi:hypothetical protein
MSRAKLAFGLATMAILALTAGLILADWRVKAAVWVFLAGLSIKLYLAHLQPKP